MSDDKRLIEDYLPIGQLSVEASREKKLHKGQISTVHLWWARRPLVACRAAVYATLVPAPSSPHGREEERKVIEDLCRYPPRPAAVAAASKRISDSTKTTPKVLDFFAGGGSIPLEALRLGCDSFAVDINPVAHLIELSTLVYPQQFGQPNNAELGATGAKDKNGRPTWGGLAGEVEYWGKRVIEAVQDDLRHLYPNVELLTSAGGKRPPSQKSMSPSQGEQVDSEALIPISYLWTRTVPCRNPSCAARFPLAKQTWLAKKPGRFIALRNEPDSETKKNRYRIVQATSQAAIGFDPGDGTQAGSAVCPFCGSVVDGKYLQKMGCEKAFGHELMAVVCARANERGRQYIPVTELTPTSLLNEDLVDQFLLRLLQEDSLDIPREKINPIRPSPNARGLSAVTRYGLSTFADLFTKRQLATHLTFAKHIRKVSKTLPEGARSKAVVTALALVASRATDWNSSQCRWFSQGESGLNTFGRQALSMLWDFCEGNPLCRRAGSFATLLDSMVDALPAIASTGKPAHVVRGSATHLDFPDESFDAIVTDPPYYDNVPYADISDYFYVWLKRSVRELYPNDFASELTPKRQEATALASRHGGDMDEARREYEAMMEAAFREANRVLKPDGRMVVVYAHKTTLGWTTLVNALQCAGFTITEAWPLETEMGTRLVAADAAALASSIFLVSRKRFGSQAGLYETAVRPELESIVRERVETLWEMGISGADLVIACVGAGLRAFTKYARVEYSNGEDVPAVRFLAEVETVVLETILGKLSETVGSSSDQTTLAGLDPATRFYVLWRYTYGAAELDAGEAIIFANGTHVELDGHRSLTQGKRALLEKKKSMYRLHDYTERGDENTLGHASDDGSSAPAIDALHRLLWLLEHKPLNVPEFLSEAKPNLEQLRLVAQALGGPALSGGELPDVSSTAEQSALGKLLANWSTVMVGKAAVEDRRTGQEPLFKA